MAKQLLSLQYISKTVDPLNVCYLRLGKIIKEAIIFYDMTFERNKTTINILQKFTRKVVQLDGQK